MAPRGLTAITIEKMKPGYKGTDPTKRLEIPDPGCTGLYVIVQPSGRKSFAVRYRHEGRTRKLTISTTTLAEARKAATEALHVLAKGVDPGAAKAEAALRTAVRNADTLAAVTEEYLRREGPKLRTLAQRKDTFERLILPVLGSTPIADIKRSDVVRLLDKVEDKSGPRMADECLMAVRRVMNWHATRSDDFRSPIVRGMSRAKPAAERARDRVLTDGELRQVWHACDGMPAFGSFVRFLILTSARRNEAARMRWSEIEGLDWTLPASRNKTKQDLVRPLSAAALAVLAGVPRIDGCEYVFSNGRTPIANFSRDKRALDAASGTSGWTLHDLRRTARSLLSRAGVNADHAERCLGHVIGGIRKTYDRHEFYNEKKYAFEALAALIERIVEPQDNILPIRA
jgi:integrase